MPITRTLLLSVLILAGCGPGVTDGEFPISRGYALSDSGGDEKMIIYRIGKEPGKIVVDARVDNYVLDAKRIIVARRPAETVMRNGIVGVELSPICEYWMIDTETNAIQQITNADRWPTVRCYGV